MVAKIILLSSIIFQIIAAVLALRLIKITRHKFTWITISSAIILMAVRRIIAVFKIFKGYSYTQQDIHQEMVALIISILMLVGIYYLKDLFVSIMKLSKEKEEYASQLNESEERHRIIIDGANDAIFLADAETGMIVDANIKASKLLNKPIDEIKGMHQTQLHPPEEAERYAEIFRQHILDGKAIAENIYVVDKNGNRIPVEISSNIVISKGKKYNVGFFKDLQERIAVEKKLKISEELFKNITATAADAVIIIDDNGNISFWNSAAEKMFGYTYKEIMGKELHNILAPKEFYNDYTKGFKIFKETGEGPAIGNTLEFTAIKKNKERFPIEVSTSAIKIDNKWHAIGIIRDITDRKEAETKLKDINTKLLKINDELKELDKLKTNLLSNVSHELRTPLVAVQTYNELILDEKSGPITEKQKYQLEVCLRNIERLTQLIDNLLDFSRISSGTIQLNIEEINLNQIIIDVIDSIISKASAKKIEIKETYPDDEIIIKADKQRIFQVIANILGNAVKFTDAGGEINIVLTKKDDNVSIEIKDTGIGISEEYLDKIFDRFYQIDSGITRKYKGTGLGLAISRDLVKLHGGNIEVESKVGEGTLFRIILPAV